LTSTLRSSASGFTLIEVMVVVTIAAVLLTMGAPELAEFLAEQRVRTMTCDLASEISFARAKAVETSRRVYMEKTGVSWLNGWRIYADLNDNGTYDAGEELKTTEAVPHGTMYTCSTVADFATNIIFRPDGRIVRTSASTANDGIYVVDTRNNVNVCDNKVRAVLFGLSGRVSTTIFKNTAACPGVVPPC